MCGSNFYETEFTYLRLLNFNENSRGPKNSYLLLICVLQLQVIFLSKTAFCPFNQVLLCTYYQHQFGHGISLTVGQNQSHYIEVAQGAISMEQNMRFVLILGRLAILKKKIWADCEQLLRAVFSCFQGQKN